MGEISGRSGAGCERTCCELRGPVAGLEDGLEAGQEGCRIGAVKGPVIEALAEHAGKPGRDEAALRRRHHHRPQGNRIHRQDRHLRRIDDGGREQRAEGAVVGDRVGAARQVIGGELARPFILSRRENVRFSTAIATILVERVIDILSLSVFVLITFYYLHIKIAQVFPQINSQLLLRLLVLPVVGLMALIVLLITTNFGEWLLRVSVKRFSEKWYMKLHNYLEAFINGFSIFKSPGLYWRVLLETAAIWALYLVPLYLMFLAFGFENTYNFGWFDANVLLTMTTIGITIAPTPGAWGIYHSFAQITLAQFYGIPSEKALAFAFVAHGVGYFLNILVGGIFFMREQARGISWRSVSHADEVAAADGTAPSTSGNQ